MAGTRPILACSPEPPRQSTSTSCIREATAAVEDLAREQLGERGCFLVRIGKPPKRAFLFRTDEPFKKITRSFSYSNCDPRHPPKIEILANGQQIVVFGAHPETKRAYSWHGGEPGKIKREDLPYIREADALAFLGAAADLLVKEFGFTDCPQPKNGNGKDDEILSDEIGANWSISLPTSSPGVNCTIQSATSLRRSSLAA